MSIRLHIALRIAIWVLTPFMIFFIFANLEEKTGTAFIALGTLFFILGQVLAFLFAKYVPAKCSACGMMTMYAGNYYGRLRYTCRNCGEHILTTVLMGGGAASHTIGPWG
jgi:predicted permease